MLKRNRAAVEAVQVDLATTKVSTRLYQAAKAQDRRIEELLANAGRGLGRGFLDQNFDEAMRVVDTNITGTLYWPHRFGRDMREHGFGKILITGSIAGFMAGPFQAVYNGTKAFLNSFSYALRDELKDSAITVSLPDARRHRDTLFSVPGCSIPESAPRRKTPRLMSPRKASRR